MMRCLKVIRVAERRDRREIQRYIYLAAVIGSAVAFSALSFFFVSPELDRDTLIRLAVLLLLSFIFELRINFPLFIQGSTSFSTVSYAAMIFMLPFPLPILGAIVVLLNDLRERKPWVSVVFNPANYALTFGISSLIWYLFAGHALLDELSLSVEAFAVIVLVLTSFYAVNVALLNGYLAITNRRNFSYIWLSQDLDFMLPYISLEVVGLLFALAWETTPVIIPFLIVPAFTTYLAFETIQRLQLQTQNAMFTMADAIDARDPYTAEHSRRVTELAVRIGEQYGLNARDIDSTELAARVHDLGKIGISDDILNKRSKLTDAEWKLMRQHPVIGEQLLSSYRQFRKEAAIVRSHHERWDGSGYPDGLRGRQIPIGARIIAVADSFDAMTSNRPYRAALRTSEAMDEIRQEALTQFDPQVVASFLQVMEALTKVRPLAPGERAEESEHHWYSSLRSQSG